MNYKKLSIFTQYGETYTFKDVQDFLSNESMITFSFLAQSDGERKKARIFTSSVVGYTFLEQPLLEVPSI